MAMFTALTGKGKRNFRVQQALIRIVSYSNINSANLSNAVSDRLTTTVTVDIAK